MRDSLEIAQRIGPRHKFAYVYGKDPGFETRTYVLGDATTITSLNSARKTRLSMLLWMHETNSLGYKVDVRITAQKMLFCQPRFRSILP